ncbi:hypothetical protein TOTORO_01830 [Serratia phage vB_SmaS-Totoro]|nr:hypothetical protein TOTORO_01830 [Serratia phage vB_SmaS-Totoro]
MFCVNQYLFNSFYTMLSENGDGKIFMSVNADGIANPVIRSYANNGVVNLNISMRAARMHVSNAGIEFEAGFGGRKQKDFFAWDHIEMMWAPNHQDLGIYPLPMPVKWMGEETVQSSLGSLVKTNPDVDNLTKVNDFVPMERSVARANPFSVIKGGKE